MSTAKKKPVGTIPVSRYIEEQIALSGMSQKDIAEAIGYDRPNIITMFKTGATKLPLNKVVPLAKVLGIDSMHLFRLCVREYHPELLEVLDSIVGRQIVTEAENKLLDVIRDTARGHDLSPSASELEGLRAWTAGVILRQHTEMDATMRGYYESIGKARLFKSTEEAIADASAKKKVA